MQSVEAFRQHKPVERGMAYLWEAFLLQVSDNALAQQSGGANDVQHFIVVVAQKREFEAVFGWIECDGAGPCRAVETVHCLSLDTGQIDRVIESADHAMITVLSMSVFRERLSGINLPLRQAILYMVQGRVNEDTCVIPCT